MATLINSFRLARFKGVPLVIIRTPDAAATADLLQTLTDVPDAIKDPGFLFWDAVRGIRSLNDAGKAAIKAVQTELQRVAAIKDEASRNRKAPVLPSTWNAALDLLNPDAVPRDIVDALVWLALTPKNTISLFQNPHLFWKDPGVLQGVLNLRDDLKRNWRMAVFLVPYSTATPIELQHDVIVFDHPLPTEDELTAIVKERYTDLNLTLPADDDLSKTVDAVRGLAAFPCEQVVAMAVTPNGIDRELVWEGKRQSCENAKGVTIWRGHESFADLKGVDAIEQFMRDLYDGPRRPRAIVFLDEIDKTFGSGLGDSNGITDDYVGALCIKMQNDRAPGILLNGPPGSGKSTIAKVTANLWDVPLIIGDTGAMHGSLEGQSQENFRAFLRIVDAVSGGEAFYIAACNRFSKLEDRPEFLRRFKLGRFFVDYPNAAAKADIWTLKLQAFGLEVNQPRPDDTGWSGAEIENCCELAWRFRKPLTQVSRWIVPVSIAQPQQVAQARRDADGRLVDAATGDFYKIPSESEPSRGRAVAVDVPQFIADRIFPPVKES